MKVVHKGPQVVHFAPLLFTSHRSLHTQPRSHFVIRASGESITKYLRQKKPLLAAHM